MRRQAASFLLLPTLNHSLTKSHSLRNQILHHLPMHIGQTEAAALVEIRQPFVIHAQQAQHCGVEVVDVDAAFRDVVTEIIRLAIDQAGLHAAASHPCGEAARMMVAPVIVRREFAL